MSTKRLVRWRRSLEAWFPERHLYVRSGGEMRAFVLSTRRQMSIAAGVAVAALWMGVASAHMVVSAVAVGGAEREMARNQAKYERWIADREARLDSAVAQLSDSSGSVTALANSMLKRHAALSMMLEEFRGVPGAAEALAPRALAVTAERPMSAIRAVRLDEDRLIAQAETVAKSRADRLRLALRLAGLDPNTYINSATGSLGGPLIEAKDPRALAAVLDVDEDFAKRIQHAVLDLSAMRTLNATVEKMPLAKPTEGTNRASGFGVRRDPFNNRPAFHSGLDFSGAMMTPIHATAPGVVSFTGVRSGYGNTVEVDHGGGFKTRYAHLSGIAVGVGQRVAIGQRVGAMGSTGRSTGPHLHYEVWVNGRAQNPDRYLRAGDYVQQTD